MLQNIQKLLERFNFEPPEGTRKKAIVDAISNVMGVTISSKQIRIQGNYAYIEASSVIRSEVMLRKGEILRQLRNSFGEGARNPVIDIR